MEQLQVPLSGKRVKAWRAVGSCLFVFFGGSCMIMFHVPLCETDRGSLPACKLNVLLSDFQADIFGHVSGSRAGSKASSRAGSGALVQDMV